MQLAKKLFQTVRMEGNMKFNNINEAQLYLLELILRDGDTVQTRGFKTLELSPLTFEISNPTDRITSLKNRNWNFSAAIGELIWHLSGSNDVSFIASYLKQWDNFSDGGRIKGSCYGYKIFKRNLNGSSQWENLVDLLKKDAGSRRAVLDLYNSKEGLTLNAIDVPCTCSLQFLVRNNRVNLVVYMRSNDIIWGLPYDFFFFSFLQELLAVELRLEVGLYTHIAGSLHLYDHHFLMANKILAAHSYERFSMGKIPSINGLQKFISTEKKIRTKQLTVEDIDKVRLESYWTDLLKVLLYYNGKKKGFTKEELTQVKSQTAFSLLI